MSHTEGSPLAERPQRRRRRHRSWVIDAIGWTLVAVGLAGLVVAVGWWWLVYGQLVGSSSMALVDAAPCLVSRSDLCSLAEALCRRDHFLGITRYSVVAFWSASLPLAIGLMLTARHGHAAR